MNLTIKNKFFVAAIALLMVALIIFLVYRVKVNKSQLFIENIKATNRNGFDSLQNSIYTEKNLHILITTAILQKNYFEAQKLMDSLSSFEKQTVILRYEGMIFEQKGDFENAFKKYDSAINIDNYSLAIENRAELFIKIEKFDKAIHDYRIPFQWNKYYALAIANTFQKVGNIDSALKYYQVYLENYPNDDSVRKKFNSFSKDLKTSHNITTEDSPLHTLRHN